MRLLFLILTMTVAALPAAAEVLYVWSRVGPDATVTARAITTDSSCPTITIDGTDRPMDVRFPPQPSFRVLTCVADLPSGARTVAIGKWRLPTLAPKVTRIALIGDTGCRIKAGRRPQNCNDPDGWPFATIAAKIATLAPDLIIHVGDYHYREAPCTEDLRCAGAAWGDNWPSWEQDFFRPGHPLFWTAPLLLVRGNHEDCSHAVRGWFIFLDARNLGLPGDDCAKDDRFRFTEPYKVPIGDLTLVMLDSSGLRNDRAASKRERHAMRMDLDLVSTGLSGRAWLVTHRPPFGYEAIAAGEPKTFFGGPDALQHALMRFPDPSIFNMMVSGDVHLFQATDLGPKWPTQLVVGISGDRLTALPTVVADGARFAGRRFEAEMHHSYSYHGFGYAIAERQADDDWIVTAYDPKGKAIADCRLAYQPRSLMCNLRNDP